MAEYDGEPLEGKVLLESEEIVFRPSEESIGQKRIKVPFTKIDRVETKTDWLILTLKTRPAKILKLSLGKEEAAKWQHKLLHPKGLLEKLGISSGLPVSLQGLPKSFLERVLQAGAIQTKTLADAKLLFLWAESIDALNQIEKFRTFMAKEAGLWVVYPKGITVIREADVRQAGLKAGLKDIKVCSFSETHTALKFVIPVSERKKHA